MKKFKTVLFILLACILAILSKVFLPSSVNVEDFDSLLVAKLGFPIVACLYFLMIYSHNAIIAKLFSQKSQLPNFQCGLRIGLSFGLVYLMGMEEVVVESSPFSEWGFPFVAYQFVMGIGEAVMALLLCLCITRFVTEKKVNPAKVNFRAVVKDDFLAVGIITLAFFIERVVLYHTGLISSDIKTFPIPTYAWTVLFGITLGICFCLLRGVIGKETSSIKLCLRVCIFAIGLCWIGFNLFIAFIFKGALADILIRCLCDVVVLFAAAVLWTKILDRRLSK